MSDSEWLICAIGPLCMGLMLGGGLIKSFLNLTLQGPMQATLAGALVVAVAGWGFDNFKVYSIGLMVAGIMVPPLLVLARLIHNVPIHFKHPIARALGSRGQRVVSYSARPEVFGNLKEGWRLSYPDGGSIVYTPTGKLVKFEFADGSETIVEPEEAQLTL